MREHLYRGKRPDNNKYVIGLPYYGINDDIEGIESIDGVRYVIKRDTLDEFSGKFDKNIKRIFENDIIVTDNGIIGIVAFNEKMCAFMVNIGNDQYQYISNNDEIIGISHDKFNLKIGEIR